MTVIRRELERIVAERSEADPKLHCLDGLALYGGADAVAHPLPDALHPDTDTHQLMGERFARMAVADGGALAAI